MSMLNFSGGFHDPLLQRVFGWVPSSPPPRFTTISGMAAMRGVGGPGFWAPKITAMDALQVAHGDSCVPVLSGLGGG